MHFYVSFFFISSFESWIVCTTCQAAVRFCLILLLCFLSYVCLLVCVCLAMCVYLVVFYVFVLLVWLGFCVFVPEAHTGLRAPLEYWHAAVLF